MRGERPLFRGLDLELRPGQMLWIRGRNGRGKTTLLRLLAGLGAPVRGEIRLADQPVRHLAGPLRRRLLYVAHANALKEDLTAIECLRFMARLHGMPAADTALHAALQRLGVGTLAGSPVRRMSQGQRRRVALARLALVPEPSVWLLDEPFDALDTEGIASLQGILHAQVARGGSVLLTSHQAPGLDETVLGVLDLDAHAVPVSR